MYIAANYNKNYVWHGLRASAEPGILLHWGMLQQLHTVVYYHKILV